MKKFSIYQVGREVATMLANNGKCTFMYGIGRSFTQKDVAELMVDGSYELVAVINAEGINDVFDIGNVGPEEQITRIKPMHSMSVGDVIIDENDDRWVVAPVGFEKLPNEAVEA